MRKLIYLTLLIISTFVLTACSNNNDNGYIQNVPNNGTLNYRNHDFPIKNLTIEDFNIYEDGISYIVELSTNPINYNGKNSGAYMYLEIFQANNLKFSGRYNTNITNQNTRFIYVIEFHVDPLLENGIPVKGESTLEVYNDYYFSRGEIFLNNYQDNLIYTDFDMLDKDGFRLTGNYEGLFNYVQKYNTRNAEYKPALRKREQDRENSRGLLRQLRAERLKK